MDKVIPDSQEEVLTEMFYSWTRHPVTLQFLKNVQKHKEAFMQRASVDCNDYTKPDAHFRHLASNMRTVDAILKMATEFEVFKKQTETKV